MRAFILLSLTGLLCACPGEPVAPPEPPTPPAEASGLPAELRPPGMAGAASERPPAGPGLPDALKPPR
ncbi:hypothetical protein [Archangium primigenium]|uniref:hypothetical protein n=1 Tax=[Archangium] primigenium TaxID=2792470 RepID=UPI00195C7144|nr:hypothetical protein [Archangium primigenium]MBM7112730.1 hypothetical protein [Archangium primigenium]